jgi:hypothetical protein
LPGKSFQDKVQEIGIQAQSSGIPKLRIIWSLGRPRKLKFTGLYIKKERAAMRTSSRYL